MIINVITKNGSQQQAPVQSSDNPRIVPVMTRATPLQIKTPTPTQPVKVEKPPVIGQIFQNVQPILKKAQDLVVHYLPQTVKTIQSLGIDPFNLKVNPKKAVSDAWESIKQPITDYMKTYPIVGLNNQTPKSVQEGAKQVKAGTGVLFAPVTALFTAANDVPVLGSLSKILTLPFTAASEGSVSGTNRIIDQLPISKQAKEQIKPALDEIVSLASQLVLAKGIEIPIVKTNELVKNFGLKDAMTIEAKAKELAKEKLNTLEVDKTHEPQQVINHVIANGIEKTPQGKELLKTAVEAQKQGVKIDVQDIRKADTPEKIIQYVTDNKLENIKEGETLLRLAKQAQTEGKNVKPVPIEAKSTKPEIKTEPVKPSFNNAQSRAVQQNFVDRLDHLRQTASGQDELTKGVEKIVNDTIENSQGDKKVLTGVRTAINKEMMGFAGKSGNYKADYALLQTLKDDPEIGGYITKLDELKQNLDERIAKPSEQAGKVEPKQFTKSELTLAQRGQKPSKIGKSIEQKAVDTKLTQRFEKTAGYTPIKIKEQAQMATKLVNENIDHARAIVRGQEPLPEGLKGISLITAMEEYVKKNPNVEIYHELANSPLVSGTSEAAQELRLAAEREPDSATAKLAEIKQAREAQAKKSGKTTASIVKDIKKEIKVPSKHDWGSFIKSIQC